ncbi:hypothetical protein BD410DRAFT_792410 [Rickenella mellea]|uniref:F-box domain-containing protein n=1 Tax=Rickenella mellea TaxID=50990 RepID=A0A4Y7PUT5_9AGAM|nr:hypothetical protein BD410DRAFT_792410 [Rickenella mellea]
MASSVFPHELYGMIIRFATYSPVYFDVSPDPQYWPIPSENRVGVDYETKKALTAVSRQFRALSLQYLYEVIELHKTSSMQRLASILDISSSITAKNGLRNPRKIKHLFVSVLDVQDKQGKIAAFNSLRRILHHCIGLQGFGFYASVLDWVEYCSDPRDWLISIPKSVRFLDWQGLTMGCNFTQMVRHLSESLVAMQFSKVQLNTSPPPFAILPHLKYLSLPEKLGGTDILYDWHMPSLSHFHSNGIIKGELGCIIERARENLQCVIVGNGVAQAWLAKLPGVARNLEEFRYHFFDEEMELSWDSVGGHPSLQHIVVVFHRPRVRGRSLSRAMSALCAHLQPLTKANFPHLRSVGFVGVNPNSRFDPETRAQLDAVMDRWNTSGIVTKFLEW